MSLAYILHSFDNRTEGIVELTSSKSESNRALLINALSGNKLSLKNLSAARDTQTMTRLMQEQSDLLDVLDAGTTMRFCTAYLGVKGKNQTITGTPRMCERPIGILVDALRRLGADITYLKNEGYPPLKITGIQNQLTRELEVPGNISSQFISALLMIGPTLPDGMKLRLTTEVFSRPYIEMTLGLMKRFGVESTWKEDTIEIAPQDYQAGEYTIESDWSGASYWYAMAALGDHSHLTLTGLREDSLQGDQEISKIMQELGVSTSYTKEGAVIKKTGMISRELNLDFKTCPDLAQTVMVVAAVLGTKLQMTGLESLKIKETDRVAAMKAELKKLGAVLEESDDTWIMTPGQIPEKIEKIDTYDDHRMAMAFAPVCQVREITVDEPGVVAKSYPDFWKDLQKIGVQISEDS